MSDPKCPACILKAGIHRVGQWPGTLTTVDKTCTGRPGCVRAIDPREAAAGYRSGNTLTGPDPIRRDSPPPASGADIVERLRRDAAISRSETDGEDSMESAAIDEAANEIARLRAEVERLTGDLDRMEASFEATVDQLNTAAADRTARALALALLDRVGDAAADAIIKGEAAVVPVEPTIEMVQASNPVNDAQDLLAHFTLHEGIAAGRLDREARDA